MLEAFERHLKQHNIAKQFEKAETKEEKIAVCKKYLEDEGYSVKSNLDAEKQYQEAERYGMVANPFVSGSHPGVISPMGKITINDMSYDPMSLAIDSSTMGSISVGSLNTFQPIQNQPFYVKAHYTLTENEELKIQDAKNVQHHIMNELTYQLNKALKSFVIDKNLIKSETNYSTLDKNYSIKVGFVE